MSTKQNSGRMHFWLVVMGLLLVISLVAGGVYFLNEQGLINAGSEEMANGGAFRADFVDGELGERPSHDHNDEAGGFNSQSLIGIGKTLLQLAVVIIAVTGGQKIYSLVTQRWRRAARPMPSP